VLVVASMLIVGLAVRRAIEGPAPLDNPSESNASSGVQVIIAEPRDRPETAVPESKAAVVPVPAAAPAPTPPTPPVRVTATPLAARIVAAPPQTPAKLFHPAARPPETLSSPADLAEDAAAAGLTGRASPPTTEDRP
jgi:hypothetical protein